MTSKAYRENYSDIMWSPLPPLPRRTEVAPARSHLPTPIVLGDTIDPTQSMADGKLYTSKAALRATYLPSGNPDGKRYTEVGNDPLIMKPYEKPKPDRKAVRQSIDKAFSRAGFGA